MKVSRRRIVAAGAAAWVAGGTSYSFAQDRRPLTLVVPFPPGGPVDAAARLVATPLGEKLGLPVVIDNRAGANALIAARVVSNAPADGRTLLMHTVSTLSPIFVKGLQYDVLKELMPVVPVWSYSNFLFTNLKGDLASFIAEAKRIPGKMNFGYGHGSGLLIMEMFKKIAGIDLIAIPYKGSANTSLAMLSREVQATVDPLGAYRSHVDAGKVHPIMLTGNVPSSIYPDVPTAPAAGFPQLDIQMTGGFWARAGSPPEFLGKVAAAMREILGQPAVKTKFIDFGWSVSIGSADDLLKSALKERSFWESAAHVANYMPE